MTLYSMGIRLRARPLVAALALVLLSCAPAAAAGPGPRGLVLQLNAALLAEPSATVTLEHWCAARRLADPPVVTAEQDRRVVKPAGPAVRAMLQARPGEQVRYRHVALVCGGRVLSNADNWYLPARLTPAMNRELETTDHPFGLVVKALGFRRRRLEARVLVAPGARRAPAAVLRHEAVLVDARGVPFSLVVETYTRAVLDEGPRRPSTRR